MKGWDWRGGEGWDWSGGKGMGCDRRGGTEGEEGNERAVGKGGREGSQSDSL